MGSDSFSWTGAVVMMLAVGVVIFASGLITISMARRTADGRMGPNGWAGTRTRATRSSPEAWQAAHIAALRPTTIGGWILTMTAPLALLGGLTAGDPDRAMTVWGILLGIGSMIATVFIVYGAWLAQRTAVRYNAT